MPIHSSGINPQQDNEPQGVLIQNNSSTNFGTREKSAVYSLTPI